jgi:hypothetical protein
MAMESSDCHQRRLEGLLVFDTGRRAGHDRRKIAVTRALKVRLADTKRSSCFLRACMA